MIISLIFAGPSGDLEHRGGENTRKKPNFCIFIDHHHHFNLLIIGDKKIPGVEFACFMFITGADMDQELKSQLLNVSQLAALSGVHRQTVAARLKNVGTSGGHDSNLKLYLLTDVLAELMKLPPPVAEGEMDPQDRKAWYQSERERLKFEQEVGELIPASDVAREFAEMAKAMIQVLETLPDILERDCALAPSVVTRVQSIIDDLRDDIARRVMSDEKTEEDIPEEE